MKKLFALFLVLFLSSFTFAHAIKTYNVSPKVISAIEKYKAENYVGAYNDLLEAVKVNDKDSLAQYYLGNVLCKLGKKEEAVKAYTAVDTIADNKALIIYARNALACLEGAETCGDLPVFGAPNDINKFIRSGEFISTEAKTEVQNKSIEQVKDMINGQAPNIQYQNFHYLNDASDAMPTDKEIADAVKTLAKVGYNPANIAPQNYAMMAGYNNNIDYELLPMLMNRGMGNVQNMDSRALQNYLTSGMLQGFDMGIGQGRGF
ncbi:hypothetical protein IJC60_02375 [bacterium]|nr:hypothetical protein [bacterium]